MNERSNAEGFWTFSTSVGDRYVNCTPPPCCSLFGMSRTEFVLCTDSFPLGEMHACFCSTPGTYRTPLVRNAYAVLSLCDNYGGEITNHSFSLPENIFLMSLPFPHSFCYLNEQIWGFPGAFPETWMSFSGTEH